MRSPAVAGLFYSDDASQLRREVRLLLARNKATFSESPRAIIAPHAGYRYSGTIAAAAFSCFDGEVAEAPVVFLLGPPHRVHVEGIALPKARAFRTPLGDVPLHRAICDDLHQRGYAIESEEAHAGEHCLEVELPFLQEIFKSFFIVPLLVGDAAPETVANLLYEYWNYPGALFVVSTDLSHFLDYDTARACDQRTVERIVSLSSPHLGGGDACGFRAVNGLVQFAANKRLRARVLRLENSGDHGGPRTKVVGYAAMGMWDEQ